MFRKTFCIALAVVIGGAPTQSQIGWAKSKAQNEVAATERIKAKVSKLGVGTKSQVTVKLRDKVEIKGYIKESGDTSFVIVDSKSGELKTVAYSDVKEVRGKGLSKGAKIAIVSGLCVGISIAVGLILWSLYGD